MKNCTEINPFPPVVPTCTISRNSYEEYARSLLQKALDLKIAPGFAFGAVHPNWEKPIEFCLGQKFPNGPEVESQHLYDVASVTKFLPTSLLAFDLVHQGKINLDDKVSQYIPELSGRYSEKLLIRHLFSYAFDRVIKVPLDSVTEVDTLRNLILRSDLRELPGNNFTYRNTTSYMLKLIIERMHGRELPLVAQDVIFKSLGLKDATFNPVVAIPTNQNELRGNLVHDPFSRNISRVLGEQSGAAGLFISPRDSMEVLRYLTGFHRTSFPNFSSGMGVNQFNPEKTSSRYGLGVDLLHQDYGPCECCERDTLAITGYTGCSFIWNRDRFKGFYLLSNAVFNEAEKRDGIGKSPLYHLRRALFYKMQYCKHCFS